MTAHETASDAGASRTARLRDGSTVEIRPIAPDDKERLAEGFRRLSPAARRHRFLVAANELSPEDLEYLTEVDHRRHEALVALAEHGDLVGVARYVRAPGEREAGEVAVVVADDWRRRGLATELLGRLTERARENGLRSYSALVAEDNEVVIEALDRIGATRRGVTDDGEIEYEIDFPPEGIGDRLRQTLRAAGSGQLDLLAALGRRLALWRRP